MYQIENPCNEDWSKMTPVDNGRFCATCNRCVLDLSKATEQEQMELYGKGECVTISTKQLAQLNRTSLIKQFAIASFLIFGSALYSYGEGDYGFDPSQIDLVVQDSVKVSGQVLRKKAPNKPYAYLVLTCEVNGTEYQAYTDENGFYTFFLPSNSGKVTIEATSAWTQKNYAKWSVPVKTEPIELKPQKVKHIPKYMGKF